jgi:hypothetical protein
VQTDAVDHRAASASRRFEIVCTDAVSETRHAPAGAWSRRGAVSDRGGVELTEHAAIARERVCLVGTSREQPAAFEQTDQATRDRSGDSLE